MTIAPDGLFQYGGVPVGGVQALGMGNVYYVCQAANALYSTEFITSKVGHYSDKSARVHATIASALTATVANRNDYVIVMPDTYTITTMLTISKNTTHLICPSGLGTGGMGTCIGGIIKSYGTAIDTLTISANNVEVAGIMFQSSVGKNSIVLSTGCTGVHIHDNFFGLSSTASSNNYGIYSAAASSIYLYNFSDNHFTNYSPGAMTSTDNDVKAFIGMPGSGNTRGIIRNNVLVTGNNTKVAAGLDVGGSDLIIDGNLFFQTAAHGAAETGTFTKGIDCSANAAVTRNVFAGGITANNCIAGPAADSCVGNFAATDGLIRVDTGGSHAFPST